MSREHFSKIAGELNLTVKQVTATAALLDEGATVPFIARYRKEVTGSIDEVAITSIRDLLTRLRELEKRREAIIKSLHERGKLTEELKEKILAADTMSVLEDTYLPYRPKRRTRATIAREKGLEPLAQMIFSQKGIAPFTKAEAFIDSGKGVDSVEDAVAGARDIIAEWVNEDQKARAGIRRLFHLKGFLRSKAVSGKEEAGIKYKDYFDWEEPVKKAPSHRILAIRRGEKEGFLNFHIASPEDEAIAMLESIFIKGDGEDSRQVKMAVRDSYKRLLSASMETEIRLAAKKRAEEEAIKVFAENLRHLLLAPPMGQKKVLAIDPGFRTGCKVVCLGRQGRLVDTGTIYPHRSDGESSLAAEKIRNLCEKFDIEAIAIGNGTAGRETEEFIRKIGLSEKIQIVMVNENGASVYSASEAAREEFPDQDVTVRGSVSIGRRLMDPLSEL
ncbi:MAG: Tex-like N-terminal domain-containing protein, partial [Thermodesulfobacteriota bacterium]